MLSSASLGALAVEAFIILLLTQMSAKLFVGQIPKHINEDQLRPIFQEYGEIVELAILRDKFTQVHKGLLFFLEAVVDHGLKFV